MISIQHQQSASESNIEHQNPAFSDQHPYSHTKDPYSHTNDPHPQQTISIRISTYLLLCSIKAHLIHSNGTRSASGGSHPKRPPFPPSMIRLHSMHPSAKTVP
mmetsp:Transcript_2348/g.5008  ORF Transcript_2348/g.5008 Transcript_2348/m.5008 type:complete len:103 (-) Transcript_2348:78-386(-)